MSIELTEGSLYVIKTLKSLNDKSNLEEHFIHHVSNMGCAIYIGEKIGILGNNMFSFYSIAGKKIFSIKETSMNVFYTLEKIV